MTSHLTENLRNNLSCLILENGSEENSWKEGNRKELSNSLQLLSTLASVFEILADSLSTERAHGYAFERFYIHFCGSMRYHGRNSTKRETDKADCM